MSELSPLIEGLINEGIDVTLVVTGNSMRPMLTNFRDSVVLTACDPLGLKKGDIPLYKRDNGQYVLHRIVKVHDSCYDIIGDHQTEIERSVPKTSVICVVKAFTRDGRYHACDEFGYKLYKLVWCLNVPLRSGLLKFKRLCSKPFGRKQKTK